MNGGAVQPPPVVPLRSAFYLVSSPWDVRAGEPFKIVMGTDRKFAAKDKVVCERSESEDFGGPQSVENNNGSFVFELHSVLQPGANQSGTKAVSFYLMVNGQLKAKWTVRVGIKK